MTDVSLRLCGPGDEAELRRLAERDTADPPTGTVLAAEVGGRLLAALSLETGATVADPFAPTRALVDLLRARARQIEPRAGRPRTALRDLLRHRQPDVAARAACMVAPLRDGGSG